MTTYTSISNASVAVGGIPSSATVTALRDNPIAIAEGASGTPVVSTGWHPVDKVTVGDTKNGLIYDFAVTGVVANVITPDFEDGFEYRILCFDMSHNDTGGNRSFNLDLFKATSATYVTAFTSSNVDNFNLCGFDGEMLMPRLDLKMHMVRYGFHEGSNMTTATSIGGAFNNTLQKVLRARVRFSSGSIDSGKVFLFRRREYATTG